MVLNFSRLETSKGLIELTVAQDGEMRGVYLGDLRKMQAAAGIGVFQPESDESDLSHKQLAERSGGCWSSVSSYPGSFDAEFLGSKHPKHSKQSPKC